MVEQIDIDKILEMRGVKLYKRKDYKMEGCQYFLMT